MTKEKETINNLPAGWYVSVGAIGAIILVLCIGLAIFEASLTKCPCCEHDVFALKYCHDCGADLTSTERKATWENNE